jgi:hypothetical protein
MTNEVKAGADIDTPFFYAEETGLALFLHRGTGTKFWIDEPVWKDLVSSIKAGWKPWKELPEDRSG